MQRETRKQSILIVDDSPLNIKMLGETLMVDYEIRVSTSGMEALEIATSHRPPDLVLLDITMPGMDGYEVCERMKNNERSQSIPIIFITARTEEEEETRGFELGAVDYITKPFSPDVVKARVRTHLDLKLYQDHLEELVRERTEDLKRANEELEARVEERTAELSWSNRLLTQEIAERKRSEVALKENEEYLRTIMATIQTGLFIIDPRSGMIIDANPWAARMVGYQEEELIGVPCRELDGDSPKNSRLMPEFCIQVNGDDCILKTKDNRTIHVRRSFAAAVIKDHEYFVHSLLDITDIKKLMKKQEVSIDLAKNLLKFVNGVHPRYIPISESVSLFIDHISVPCYAEGGDHLFVRNIPSNNSRGKTILTLKDQSGHEVSCVLRSIMTDMIHHSIIDKHADISLEKTVGMLNDRITTSDLFDGDDFFTSVYAEIDHETLLFRYLSAGHPSFVFIRNNKVSFLPENGDPAFNLPIGVAAGMPFKANEFYLQPGDRILFFTDGLTEMPIRNKNRMIGQDELAGFISEILGKNPNMPVSRIMNDLLDRIAEISDEKIILEHSAENRTSVNTSGDDITILCLEVERNDTYDAEWVHYVGDADKISSLCESIFEKLEPCWKENGFESPESRLRIVVEESLMNAWIHGNGNDPKKSITVRYRMGNDFHFEVIDEGDGFDLENIPDPTTDENITKTCGRGLFCISHFSDEMKWKENGRHLVVTFKKNKVHGQTKKSMNA